MKNLVFALSLIVCNYSALASVQAPKSGAVKFQATASPGALAIRGVGDAPTGQIDLTESADRYEVSGSLRIKLDSFKTGIAMRDTHMKEKYLEAGKYPEALLILSKQSLPASGSGAFEGELVLHAVKHKVSGKAEIKKGEGGFTTVMASFPVKLQDHGIEIPTFAGISVANEVAVETEIQMAPLSAN